MEFDKITKQIDDVFATYDDSFLQLTVEKVEPEPEPETIEEEKDELIDVKKEVMKKGYKITDIDVEKDKFRVEVRKGNNKKILSISTDELKSSKDLLKSISAELS